MDILKYCVIGVVTLLTFFVGFSITKIYVTTQSDFDELQEQCNIRDISCERTYFAKDNVGCFDDCISFGYVYYIVKDGGFGADNNCWCIKNDTPIQIW